MYVEAFVVSPIGSNCYVVAEANEPGAPAVVIDPGDTHLDAVFACIDGRQFDLQAVWCTHAHFDHVLGVDLVRDRYGVPAFVHEADLPVWNDVPAHAQAWLRRSVDALRSPDESWQEGSVASIGKLDFRVVHTPGHSPGSICLAGDAVAFTGDMLFRGSIGRVDLPYSDPEAMNASLVTVSHFDDGLILYPGHGPTSTMKQERATNPFVISLKCQLF